MSYTSNELQASFSFLFDKLIFTFHLLYDFLSFHVDKLGTTFLYSKHCNTFMFLLQLGVLKDRIKTSNSKEEIESLRLSEKSLINKVHLSAVF